MRKVQVRQRGKSKDIRHEQEISIKDLKMIVVQLASIRKPSHPMKSWLASRQLQRGQTGQINLSYHIPFDCLATAKLIDRPKYVGICSPTGLFF